MTDYVLSSNKEREDFKFSSLFFIHFVIALYYRSAFRVIKIAYSADIRWRLLFQNSVKDGQFAFARPNKL